MSNILTVDDLTIQFPSRRGWVTAVENVTFGVAERECLGIVGESGSGKSVTALSILRLHAPGSFRLLSGNIRYRDRDLLALPSSDLRRIRGSEIAMIFQDPMSSLNPVLTVADQIGETLRIHQGLSRDEARRKAIELLKMVRISDAERRVDEYPHRLSGGMRQRVMIAMAIACRPRLLIADEPTTALDVTIQAQILDLLRDLQAELGMSIILISHDLGVVAELASRAIVMYAGQIVEQAPAGELFDRPMHPYTQGLLAAMPSIDLDRHRLDLIPGKVPDPADRDSRCRFLGRCPKAVASCAAGAGPLAAVGDGHIVRCRVQAAPAGDTR